MHFPRRYKERVGDREGKGSRREKGKVSGEREGKGMKRDEGKKIQRIEKRELVCLGRKIVILVGFEN